VCNDPPILEGDRREAAVALVLRANGGPDLLLIKRADSARDPWSGQMALPGGRKDHDDTDLLSTAMRETLEEVGLDLGRLGRRLGRLDDVQPNSARLPSLTITPFVFGVPADSEARVASHEIAEVHWVSLEALRDPGTLSTVDVPLPGEARTFPCYRVVGEVVWGLTFRIIEQFLEVYPDLDPIAGRWGSFPSSPSSR